MALTIPVAHDFICPWCWIGWKQARKLQNEFDVQFDWLGYELIPDALEWPNYASDPPPPNKPETLSRLQFLEIADGIFVPKTTRPHQMRTHNAHEAVEYAKTEGVADQLIDRLYPAYWQEGEEINDVQVLVRLAQGIVRNLDALADAIEKKQFADRIVPFDDDAYAAGVYNVPTFYIGGGRYAEQPYSVLQRHARMAVEESGQTDLYQQLKFPPTPEDRPYTFINMVATIDGKILSGHRDETVSDLGSKIDHLAMKRIEGAADAIMVGAQTLRATSPAWDPASPRRIVLTRSGDLPKDAKFFTGGQAFLASPVSANVRPFGNVQLLPIGKEDLDLPNLLKVLRLGLGVQRLLVSGGSVLNAQLLKLDLVDELFLTIAPKVKLGKDVPTYADGEALPREALLNFDLVENRAVGNEVFLRYRRRRDS